jgi:hypothetical protein
MAPEKPRWTITAREVFPAAQRLHLLYEDPATGRTWTGTASYPIAEPADRIAKSLDGELAKLVSMPLPGEPDPIEALIGTPQVRG